MENNQRRKIVINIDGNNKSINNKRVIPNVPKSERQSFEIGFHDIPNFILYLLGVIIIILLYIKC